MTRVFHCAICRSTAHTSRNHYGSAASTRKSLAGSIDQKAKNLRNHYRLELADYMAMLARGCGICGTDLNDRTPDVDHDHACDHPGKGQYSCRACVRGLLCRGCNLRVGSYERGLCDDIAIAIYLGTAPRHQDVSQLAMF
jgi:hypothetical protein